MARMHLDELAWWGGTAALVAILAEDVVAHTTDALPVMAMWLRTDLLAAASAWCVVAGFVKWMIVPIREVWLHGWHARGEDDDRRRREGQPDAQVRYLPATAFASSLAEALPADKPVPDPRRGPRLR